MMNWTETAKGLAKEAEKNKGSKSFCNNGLESVAQKHKQAYDEILKHLQDAEMAARNKKYITARTCAMNAVDCSAKWHKAF
jgi:hypothetical protein